MDELAQKFGESEERHKEMMLEKMQRLKYKNDTSMERRFQVRDKIQSEWDERIMKYQESAFKEQ